jgi:PA14 domain
MRRNVFLWATLAAALLLATAGLLAPVRAETTSSNTAPVATIETPDPSLSWAVDDIINFSGSATDDQDGPLPASKLSWKVIMHHCSDVSCTHSHEHVIQEVPGVASGQFTAPDHDWPVYMELRLTATDSGGLTGTDSVYLHPKTVELSFRSEPSGLELYMGGDGEATPFERTMIVGSMSSISAPAVQTLGGVDYEFGSWSDGGARSHDIIAGAEPATYTATYHQADTTAPEAPMVEGLKAEYDDDAAYGGGTDFDDLHTTRIDPRVDFSWGIQAPAPGMGADDFAVKWSGEVYVPEAGDTTFYVASNDGHRLYIDDALKLDNWKTGNFTGSGEKSVTLDLSAGWHRIEVWQFEGVNNAAAKLSYDPAGAEVKQVIPSNRLRSSA